jgi:hypothetical protein
MHARQCSEAVAEIEQLADAEAWPADRWFDFACVYAVASTTVAGHEAAYADRAMELLARAVDVGYQDFARIAADSELDPLRGREDFRKLVAGLEAKKD